MRKGADSYGHPTRGHTSRGVRHSRRRDAVWLITDAPSTLMRSGQPHQTAGALALDNATHEGPFGAETRRCALIIECDSALAGTLVETLQAQFEPEWSVRRISDSRLLAVTPQSEVPEIIVLDANSAADEGADRQQRLSALARSRAAQLIFITSDTSYQLSQRGVMSGVVLREWRHLDDIVSLVIEALTDEEAGA